jgi:hypothetical protein
MDSMADEAMAKNMQKVTVASDSKKGLKEGLEKAEEVLEQDASPENMEMDSEMEDEKMSMEEKVEDESYNSKPDFEDMDEEEMTDEEIDNMIAMLKDKKNRMGMMKE